MPEPTSAHYERLAAAYDDNWTYSADYVTRFARSMADALALTSDDVIADIGCGTGLYARQLVEQVRPVAPILCVDPVQPMLDQLPDQPSLRPVRASAEDVATGRVALPTAPGMPVTAFVVKEAIHHVHDQPATIAGLVDLLAPGGRVLVAMLPVQLRYPLFDQALARHAELQPDPSALAESMTAAGLDAVVEPRTFEIRVERDRYLDMVRSRYMSVLSTFTDEELAAGMDEIADAHPEPTLTIPDDFLFIVGRKRPAAV